MLSKFFHFLLGRLAEGNDKESPQTGAEILKKAALHFHQQRQDSSCMMLPC